MAITTAATTRAATILNRGLRGSFETSGYAPLAGEIVGSESASRAKARWEAEWKRCEGSFSRQRRTTRSTATGVSGESCEIDGGSSLRMALVGLAGWPGLKE